MKLAILADIHGNYIALQRCLEYAKKHGAEAYLFLGDYLGELAYPDRTMDMIYTWHKNHACYFVKGNKEDYWLGYGSGFEKSWIYGNSTTGTFLYQYERLREKDLEFFKALPIVQKVEVADLPAITICHGSPRHVKEEMRELDEKTIEILEECETDMILCGHTHRRVTLEYDGKVVYNPGSVGIPLDSDSKAQFMLLQSKEGHWEPEFVDLEYDVEQVIAEMYEAGLDKYAPYWCRSTELLLRTGKISNGQVLKRVMKLCNQEEGKCDWPYIPEKYWERVIEQVEEELIKYTKTQ
ncbi:MAG: metallophosphoesterase family protein [Lachnospiraceae bacterium]|nr:metallophosphoesterase family protein [Lachnospiraceae bacterium]